MNSPVVISVENLGKRYRISHRAEGQPYLALRDIIAEKVRGLFRSRNSTQSHSSNEDFWALKDVSFEIKQGEVVGIIGRNGAGKSTLLKILSRITEPSKGHGRVRIKGRVASLLEVGTGFHPELTGRENIYLNGAILGMTRVEIRRKFDEIVAFAEVEKFLDTPVKRYSSGMYVRLAFAVAAHLEPEILVVDEVLAVGDAQFQKKCLGKMRDVSKDGRTVLFVSHNLGVIRSLCEKVCWLDRGRLLQVGPTVEVVDAYLREGVQKNDKLTDTSTKPRVGHYGEKLRILQLECWPSLPLVHDSPCRLEIHFESLNDVEEITVGIGFSSLDGTRLLTYETDLYGPRPNIAKGKNGSVRFEIEALPLAPGYYSLDVGVRSGDLYGIDYLPGVSQIEVIPGKRTPGNLLLAGAGVRIPAHSQWKGEMIFASPSNTSTQ